MSVLKNIHVVLETYSVCSVPLLLKTLGDWVLRIPLLILTPCPTSPPCARIHSPFGFSCSTFTLYRLPGIICLL